MKKIFALILLAIIMTGIGACSKDSTSIVGSWSRTYQGELLVINFYDNGSAISTIGTDQNPPGTYSTSGSSLTINSEDCSSAGKYTFSIDKDILTIGLVSDNCSGRNEVIPGIYIKY